MEMRVHLKKRVALPATMVVVAFLALVFMVALAAITPIYPEATGDQVKSGKSVTLDYSHADQGYVMIKHSGTQKKLMVQITMGKYKAQHYMRGDGEYDVFALPQGSGKYKIGIFEHKSGKNYAQLMSETVNAKIEDEFSPFVMPNRYTNYTAEMAAVAKADELFAGLTEDKDKINAAWEYLKANMVYDYVKAATIQGTPDYTPVVDEILQSGKGICFDYSALFGTMLRSHGIPTQMIFGYLKAAGNKQYHAWNNVYLDGEWHLMDSTFAMQAYPDNLYAPTQVN